jgi:arsenate reductase
MLDARRLRVLFLCIGNSCRSQMAEGFARTYGSDVMEPLSAGLYPARDIAMLTKLVMIEKNIDISEQFPKGLESVPSGPVAMVINMSGQKIPTPRGSTVEEWTVLDPIGMSEDVFREVAADIEQRVMRLVLSMRAKLAPAPARRI